MFLTLWIAKNRAKYRSGREYGFPAPVRPWGTGGR